MRGSGPDSRSLHLCTVVTHRGGLNIFPVWLFSASDAQADPCTTDSKLADSSLSGPQVEAVCTKSR